MEDTRCPQCGSDMRVEGDSARCERCGYTQEMNGLVGADRPENENQDGE